MDLGLGHEWILKGEGNANAVFAYCGAATHLIGNVLRVRKLRKQSAQADGLRELEQAVWAPVAGLFTAGGNVLEHVYVNTVMRKLVGPDLVAEQVAVTLPVQLANHLLIELQRKGRQPGPPALSGTAILMLDHTFAHSALGKSLCVELKPKCGFLPHAAEIAPQHDVKRRVSRFQLHQALKLSQGSVTQRSSYDPLDLFSGDQCRMACALRALLATPQNNLRLFLDGQPVDEQYWSISLGNLLGGGDPAAGISALVAHVTESLLQAGVLEKILAVQQLDSRDIEGVYPVFSALAQWHRKAEQVSEREIICGSDEEMSAYCVLRDYLLAASAKDCSIMVTLAILDRKHVDVARSTSPTLVPSSIAVIDLDFKPLVRVCAHYELDCNILKANGVESFKKI